ncbi:ZIP family zinc transporter [Desulfitispora alkaliphila]|uniref:ZIP family metal transporter n=1 Tax=Desulfitispora alkaliphila TaxID=622674 RepID=UPI003D236AAB
MGKMLIISAVAGLATVLGALIVVALGKPSERKLAAFLGGAAGIMLVVVVLDLIPSAITYGSIGVAFLGFITGAAILWLLDKIISRFHDNRSSGMRDQAYLKKMGYLIAVGIALHDLPEGIAIAVGYAATENLGLSLALAIGMHNIPEGMAVAAPMRMAQVKGIAILGLTLVVALFTPLGALIGFALVTLSQNSMAFLLALAGGAMGYIVVSELVPESMRRHPNYAKLGIAIGIIIMTTIWFLH